MTTLTSISDQVAGLVRCQLTERFADEFVFDPIVVVPKVDHDGDEYLQIYIVFDGEQAGLDAGWTAGLPVRIRPDLLALGVPNVPTPSFIAKPEWEQSQLSKRYEPARLD